MRKPVSSYIGLRYFLADKKNRFISFVSLISVAGLTLGVAALVVTLSVMNGFERELRRVVLDVVPHATVYANDPIEDWQPFLHTIKNNDDNIEAVAPFVYMPGMLSNSVSVHSVLLTGVVPSLEQKVSAIGKRMKSGSLASLEKNHAIVLGEKAAQELGLSLGDELVVIIPKPSASIAGVTPKFKKLTLTGIYKSSPQIESSMAFVSMASAAQMVGVTGALGFRLKLKNIFIADAAANRAKSVDDGFVYTDSWMNRRGDLYQTLQMQRTMLGLMIFMIIIVAVFNVVSSLIMAVTEKKQDIAILKTLGFSMRHIQHIFMVQGVIIALLGIGAGLVLGLLLSTHIGSLSSWLDHTFALGLFDSYYVDQLPSEIRAQDVMQIVLASILVTLIATLYPARKAAKIIPSQALKSR